MGWATMSVQWKGLNNNGWVCGEMIWVALDNPTFVVDDNFCSLLFIDKREMF